MKQKIVIVLSILLFSFLSVWGQDLPKINKEPDWKKSVQMSIVPMWPDSNQMAFVKECLFSGTEYFTIMLVGAWDLYAKEYYADSTYEGWGQWYSSMRLTWWAPMDSTATWIKPVQRFSHREPTFQGFIEFLRRR